MIMMTMAMIMIKNDNYNVACIHMQLLITDIDTQQLQKPKQVVLRGCYTVDLFRCLRWLWLIALLYVIAIHYMNMSRINEAALIVSDISVIHQCCFQF